MKKEEVDLQQELASLLRFTTKVAGAIRKVGASGYDSGKAQIVMWLSDLLQDLNYLGETVQKGSKTEVSWACDSLIRSFGHRKQCRSSFFAPYRDLFTLDEAIANFQAIKGKVETKLAA